MLNLFVESRGERVLFLLSDCGPLNHTIAIAVLLAVFLCDLVKRTLKQRIIVEELEVESHFKIILRVTRAKDSEWFTRTLPDFNT